MKKLMILALLAVLSTTAIAQTQRPGFKRPDREQIKAARIAFLTNRLELKTEQAKQFWPIFNEYENEKGQLSQKYNTQKKELVGPQGRRNMSDENATKMLDIYLDQKEAQLKLERKYVTRFREVLNARQTWTMVRFEGEFRKEVMDRMMKRRGEAKQQKGQEGNGN